MGSPRVGHRATKPPPLKKKKEILIHAALFTFMHWRRKWQPTPVFLPGESQAWGSLVDCHLWGRTESDMTETTQQQQHVISLENVLSLTSQSWKITCCMTNQRGRKANRSCSGLERGKNGRWLLIGNGIFFCGGDSALGLGSLGMTVHNWEWAKCHWIVHFKMVKIVDFMCYFTTILKDMT